MRIKEILSQHRRDFTAILVCEHCGYEEKLDTGYDDDYYHSTVIPSMVCKKCGETSPVDYEPKKPKYDENAVV